MSVREGVTVKPELTPEEWEECWNGCEDGFFNMYDDDPLFYDEDDTEVCEICQGMGGYWVCPNAENHPKEEVSA